MNLLVRALLGFLLLTNVTAAQAQDPAEVFEVLKVRAKNGDAELLYHLGMFYNNGLGTDKDLLKAFEYFEKSAQQNHPLGLYKLGCYYAGQYGAVDVDKDKAFEAKLAAAEAGYSYAQHDIAISLYQNGLFYEAIDWWDRSASQGFVNAHMALAQVHLQPDLEDKIKSIGHLRLAMRGQEMPIVAEAKMNEILSTMSEQDKQKIEEFVQSFKAERSTITVIANQGMARTLEVLGLPNSN